MPHIVVLDGHTTNPGDISWDPIREYGELTVYERTDPEAVVDRAGDAEIVLTNKTPLDAEHLEALTACQFISVLATGYDVVDVEAAGDRGIPVANVPEYSTESVAEHAIALLMEATRHVGLHDRAVKDGAWTHVPDFTFWRRSLTDMHGKTMGIVGFGRIGQHVGRIASAFGMSVLASTDSSRPDVDYGPVEMTTNRDIFERADVVSLHCPLTGDNARMVDADALAAMKPSAYLINTARGELVDEEALRQALADEQIAGAAVDVASSEPIERDNPLLDAPRCIVTPHLAWTSLEARRRLVQTTADNIAAFLDGAPQNVVGS